MAHMTTKKPSKAVSEWLREIGRKGGLAKSAAKAEAARRNAARPRPRRRNDSVTKRAVSA